MNRKALSYGAGIAATYDADRKDEEHWSKENEFVEGYFKERYDATILDIPVGTGRFLGSYPRTTAVLGVDLSPDMIEQAQKQVAQSSLNNVSFSVGDAKALDFVATESIDVIVCCRLLHLIEGNDRRKVLKEFARILKGDLILQAYLRLPKKAFLTRVASRVLQILSAHNFGRNQAHAIRPWSHIPSYPLSELELEDICTSVGLELINKTHLCFYNQEDVSMFVLRKAK